MISTVAYIAVLTVFIWFNCRSLMRKRLIRDAVVFGSIVAVDMVFGALYLLDVPLPHLGDVFIRLFHPVARWIFP
ncbi:hypothetical protein LSG31_16240 [Fodinisporobacter ferrooxydans]|uniref:Uncharacterized protein n=1 Tax=Fodinisporobacter ferrooxydans TaxID=2901836 RepID=A0ABY4CJL8_9BACL|nr:hypothetical protein LSG31_16240 [Alicyclobacillaceae bacterium MYW30-H2]